MSNARKKTMGQPVFSFLLFVAGDEPNSMLAKNNLLRICHEHLNGCNDIQIVDVLQDFSKAIDHGIIVTPTLILMQPEPRVTIYGNLNDTGKVMAALRLKGDAQ